MKKRKRCATRTPLLHNVQCSFGEPLFEDFDDEIHNACDDRRALTKSWPLMMCHNAMRVIAKESVDGEFSSRHEKRALSTRVDAKRLRRSRVLVFDEDVDDDVQIVTDTVGECLKSRRWAVLRNLLCAEKESRVREMLECIDAARTERQKYESLVQNFVAFLRDCIEAKRFDLAQPVTDACDDEFFKDVANLLDFANLIRNGFFMAVGVLYVRAMDIGWSRRDVWHNAAQSLQFSSLRDLTNAVGSKLTPAFVTFLFDQMAYEWFVPLNATSEEIAATFIALSGAIVQNWTCFCSRRCESACSNADETSIDMACYEAMKHITELLEPLSVNKRIEILRACVQRSTGKDAGLADFFARKLTYQEALLDFGTCISHNRLAPVRRSRFC